MVGPKPKDLTGMKFNNFTVLRLSTNQPSKVTKYWDCVCICGNNRSVSASNLGKIKGCGCVRKDYERTGKYAGQKRAKPKQTPKKISNFVISSAEASEIKKLTAEKISDQQRNAGITRRNIEDIREKQAMESYFSL